MRGPSSAVWSGCSQGQPEQILRQWLAPEGCRGAGRQRQLQGQIERLQQGDRGGKGLAELLVVAEAQAIGALQRRLPRLAAVASPEGLEAAALLDAGQHLVLPAMPGGVAAALVIPAHRRFPEQPCAAQQGQMRRMQKAAVHHQRLGPCGRAHAVGTRRQPGGGGVADDHLVIKGQA